MPKDVEANQDKNVPTVFQFEPEGVHAYIQVQIDNYNIYINSFNI